MKRKRILIIGPRGSGKSSLANIINGDSGPVRRVQDTIYAKETIDVPSAYLENTWMYRHLIALSQDAWCVLMLFDARNKESVYSPGFAQAFCIPVMAVVTHYKDDVDARARIQKQCKDAGVCSEPYFFDSESAENREALLAKLVALKERKGI